MALARDARGNVVQVLQPIDGSLQRVSPLAGERARVALQSVGRGCVVGFRVRSLGAIAHPRLGESTVDAQLSDFPLAIEDGWFFLSPDGKTGADRKKITHLSILAEANQAFVDIVELE